MVERHELEAFLTLAEELHFGRTAERMRVSTARVSQTIRKLERRIGAPLFTRTSRRVALTAIGRRLHADVRPGWEQIEAGLARAVAAGRGLGGTLRAGFVGAAGGQLLLEAAELFRGRYPECEVRTREAQLADGLPWLRAGEVEVLLATLPVEEAGLTTGPVLVTEKRMLAVAAGHPFARRASVSVEDLAHLTVVGTAAGPPAATFQEALTLVGADRGVFPVGAQARRYYARPGVVYVPFRDAPPLEWALIWRTDGATALVRAFAEAVHGLVRDAPGGAGGAPSG
jgi:DNA-binding transcriptional LysR family regulator